TPPRMSQAGDVASQRQFVLLLCCAAQCTTNCEPVHGGWLFERLTSSSISPAPLRGYKNRWLSGAPGWDRRYDEDEQQAMVIFRRMHYVTLTIGGWVAGAGEAYGRAERA